MGRKRREEAFLKNLWNWFSQHGGLEWYNTDGSIPLSWREGMCKLTSSRSCLKTSYGFPTSNWKHSACHCRCTVPILFLMGECDPCRGKANNLRGIREVIPRNESFTHPTSILCSLHPRHCSRAVNMTRKEPDGVLCSVGRQETNKQTDDTVSGSKKYTKENQNRSLWRKVIGQRGFLSAKEGFSEEVSLELRSKQWDLG